MTSNYTVTVLGLGAMGLPMATRLASQLTVHGFDIAEPRLELAREAGIATFTTAREAAKGANAVLLAVRNGEQLNDVLFGENGVAPVLEPAPSLSWAAPWARTPFPPPWPGLPNTAWTWWTPRSPAAPSAPAKVTC